MRAGRLIAAFDADVAVVDPPELADAFGAPGRGLLRAYGAMTA